MSRTLKMAVHWFLHQTQNGAKGIVHSNLHNGAKGIVGTLATHDWPVRDGPSPSAKVIARAQGMHIQDEIGTHQHWHNSFSIVFVDIYKGSTLQVMGMGGNRREWAIVGGTGVFSCAQGVIRKKLVETDENIVGLDIHFVYTSM